MLRRIAVGAALLLLCTLTALALLADDGRDDHERGDRAEHHGEREDREHGQEVEDGVPAVDNSLYAETCGACHFAYQPALMPADSWRRLIAGSEDHFGVPLGLVAQDADELETYLVSAAAENAPGELARDIARHTEGGDVLRVSEVPAIVSEHHDIPAAVFARESVGGRANCPACHVRAEQGDYDDDGVRIPGD